MRLKASASVATVKNTPSACTSSSFSMPIACMNGIDGITCTPVAAEITPVMRPTMPPIHFSFAACDLEAEPAQADDRVDHQQHAEHDGAVARIGSGQHAGIQPDADHGADHQRPQPPHDVAQIGADEGLPDVGDDRGHDDDGERVRRRHRDREQAHRHRRQAEPDHALDETREQEHRGDENQKRFGSWRAH